MAQSEIEAAVMQLTDDELTRMLSATLFLAGSSHRPSDQPSLYLLACELARRVVRPDERLGDVVNEILLLLADGVDELRRV